MAERCNCDASCGENRYHNAGDPGCRFSDDDEYNAYWDRERKRHEMPNKSSKETKVSTTKVSAKLAKVNESFTVNMYDNGFMIEIGGKDRKDDWKTAKIMVSTVDELIEVINEVTGMERDN